MSTLLPKLQSLTRPEHHKQILYTTTAGTALLALLAYSRHCYTEWHALGEGGVPRDIRGWLINVFAHIVARRDHRGVPAPYEKTNTTTTQEDKSSSTIVLSARDEEKYGPWSRISFFAETFSLPTYKGPRPTVPTTVLPQRQTTQLATPEILSHQSSYLHAIATSNPSLFAVRPSALESPKFDALWLIKGAVDPSKGKWFPPQAKGETVHVHHEGSTHMCLSLVDAAEVVRRGWGERHKMSGVAGVLPWGYVLVYAPREGEGDWEVWKELVNAAARVVARSAGFEGEVVVPE
ncbi:hypothetical protein F4679DRAFT_343730 [Xylaria curta]|nr:hypothetical protein F4679DRAFT_343730 [Xylaria curta]